VTSFERCWGLSFPRSFVLAEAVGRTLHQTLHRRVADGLGKPAERSWRSSLPCGDLRSGQW
jgi:hypothetical protein